MCGQTLPPFLIFGAFKASAPNPFCQRIRGRRQTWKMKISYQWLNEYLPLPEPRKLGSILTSLGLEVENMETWEEVKGGLDGLVVGEVTECKKHPDADNLHLTKVNTGKEELQIICGAPNVAAGQKVIVAPMGTTLHPIKGDPITIKKAKIRGSESQGMICAEDEIGLGESHAGIVVLPPATVPGTPVADLYTPAKDTFFELGITPNRMDAMSHLGVAKDVYAYLHHHSKNVKPVNTPFTDNIKPDNNRLPIAVTIENKEACQRYAGISIAGITVAESPRWLQQRLKSIGQRPINNIVDITNFILHETGQPLHAFDADEIKGNSIRVKNLPEGTSFVTLDEKERKLSAEDLMICNGEDEPMCIGGVFGGIKSGVKRGTKNIFLESAWFLPSSIRRSALRHNLRTDASARFEKGVDISQTVAVLKRAAALIKEIAGGDIASDIVDVYPDPKPRKQVILKNHYLKKISGKNYHPDTIKNILLSLDFGIVKEGLDDLHLTVPFSKPDISLPADIIEEIMRIDGYDNVDIPAAITIAPAVDAGEQAASLKEKTAASLMGLGFSEILTNSITNSAYYPKKEDLVKLLNNLSADLDVMRPSMLETGLETIAWNLNHRNHNLLLYEFGKTYSTTGIGEYDEQEHLCLFASGNREAAGWRSKGGQADIYYIKGVVDTIGRICGLPFQWVSADGKINIQHGGEPVGWVGAVDKNKLEQFSIKQPVFFADLDWERISAAASKIRISFTGISKYPEVHRDISMILDRGVSFDKVQKITEGLKMRKLVDLKLFDIFESEKLGAGKRSLAVTFTFSDPEKTLTDKEIDALMNKIIVSYEKELGAAIRTS